MSGLRYNQNKTPLRLISWSTVQAVAEVLEFGKRKYSERNWELGLSWSQTFDSLQRHMLAWFNGEERDPETGLLHLAHVMTNAMFLLHFAITETGTDDRPNYNNKETNDNIKRQAASCNPMEPGRAYNVYENLQPPYGSQFVHYDGQYEYYKYPDGRVVGHDPTRVGFDGQPTKRRIY